MQSINETLEMEISPQPTKRRRSSILKAVAGCPPPHRDSRTVSFNITKLIANEAMEITMMEVARNETLTSSIDMSMDSTGYPDVNRLIGNKAPEVARNETLTSSTDMSIDSTGRDVTITNQTNDTATNDVTITNKANNTTIKMATLNNFSYESVDTNGLLDDDTLFGAFHDSNISTRTSGFDSLIHNIDGLSERQQKVEHELKECRARLDSEIEDLFKFYRHVVNEQDKYEFAVAILGLRHSLWLWFKINPETYPYEKLNVRIISHKADRHLYPLKDYARTVSRFTKEGHHGYLTKFVINAQRFRRLLRKVGYGRAK